MNLKRYSDLIILQYKNEYNNKFVEILTELNIKAVNNILSKYAEAFNINTAKGKQLDYLGDLIGLKRTFNLGEVLDDDTYRFFLKLKIVKNKVVNTNPGAQSMLKQFFDGDIITQDKHNMGIDFLLFNLEGNIKKIIENNRYLLPVPAGVFIRLVVDLEKPVFTFLDIDNINQVIPSECQEINGYSDWNNIVDATYLDHDNFL